MSDPFSFLPPDCELADLVRHYDWAATPLGAPEQWSSALRMIVRFMLANRFPQLLWWGPDYVQIYNDAYAPILGAKHPEQALGKPFRDCWHEVYHILAPLVDTPYNGGPASWSEDIELILQRSGFPEECHFMFAYSPVPDESAPSGMGGVLCTVYETTEKVITERRVKILSELGARVAAAKTDEEACLQTLDVLAQYPKDVPFALFYLLEEGKQELRLIGTTGVPVASMGHACVKLDEEYSDLPWHLREALQSETKQLCTDLAQCLPAVPLGPWPDPPHSAVAVPIKSNIAGKPTGVLVIGLSAYLSYDERYREFLDLLSAPVATAVANARAYEFERRRAEALAEIDRAKTLFFSNVSHEFRTPLSLMLGPLEEVLTSTELPLATHKNLEIAHRNAQRLLKLVNSLLDFARVEAGRMEASFAPVDLCALTAEIASNFRSAMERAGLVFEVHCEDVGELVHVDRDLWEKIVLNLLSNAFKFTLEGSVIVRMYRAGDEAVLEVADTGVGVPEAEVPRLFERFHRVEGVKGRTHEGSGIGLALVQELVRMHGGTVKARSRLGEGTCMRVTLPFGTAHLPADRILAPTTLAPTVSGAQIYVQEALRWLPPEQDVLAVIPPIETHGLKGDRRFAATFGSRVLLADDNADMRNYVRALLSASYKVEAVADGAQALEAARRHRPDLVLCDVMMPNLNGFELLQALRADPQLSEVPVVMLSARAGEEARIEGLEAGADDYVVKPFHARELLARVGATLELAALRRESMQRFRAYVQASSDIVFRMNADWSEVTRLKESELGPPGHTGHSWIERYVLEEDRPRVLAAVQEAIRNCSVFELEHRIVRSDGSVGWVASRAIPLCDDDGRITEWFGTATDVTGRYTTHEELARQRVQLEEADRQKNEFLAMLAHELRNPLAPIRTASELLGRIVESDASAQAIVDVVQRQVTHLTHLVDDLLDISRITQGRIELRNETVEVAEIIRQAVETVEATIAQRQLDLQIQSSYRQLHVRGDVSRLVQIMVNLLTNAAKYTEPGGRVYIRVGEANGDCVIEVEDNGMGIAPELLPRLFDLFVQSERTLARSQGGLGIGLSVVKRLVEMHGGEVAAQSAGPGLGSTFTVRLPLVPAPPQPAAHSRHGESRTRRILVVDDNVDAANTLSMLLDLEGHHTATVHTATDALARLDSFQPDVVLLDIGLPDMDGYEVARSIVAKPEASAIKLVALTGYGQPEDRARAFREGFHAHLVKPIDPNELRRVLEAEVQEKP